MSSTKRYRIKSVSEMTGIPRNTLIAWERRHGVLAPERLANGYRLYSDDDVAYLRRLQGALAGGVAISQALASLKLSPSKPSAVAAPPGASSGDLSVSSEALFEALMRFDRRAADQVVAGLGRVPYATMIDEFYFPVLRNVGVGWDEGRLTIAQEHFAAIFVREQLVAMLFRLGSGAGRGPHLACVTFPGERHDLPLLALAVHLVLGGARVTYLGADVPEPDLVDFVERTQPEVVCVSVIMPPDAAAFYDFARSLRRASPPAMRIVIGGPGLPAGRRRKVAGVELLDDWRKLSFP